MIFFIIIIQVCVMIGAAISVRSVLSYFKLDNVCEEIHRDLLSILAIYHIDKSDEETLRINIIEVLTKIEKLDKEIDTYKISIPVRNKILSRNEFSRNELLKLL